MVLAACGQFCASNSITKNLASCRKIIKDAAAAGAKCVFLPEASDFIGSNAEETLRLTYENGEQGVFISGLQDQARESRVDVNVGVHLPTHSKSQSGNVSLWIGDQGEIRYRYQKLHLFDVEIKNGPILMESKSTLKGDHIISPFTSSVGNIGLAICYDLRFPELALRLRRLGADVLAYPSAFTLRTGAAHWELLLRSTAVQSQTYVIAAAQVGKHDKAGKRVSYGHAMICDPWGSVVAQCNDIGTEPTFCIADISKDVIARVRADMPLWSQRRHDIFPKI